VRVAIAALLILPACATTSMTRRAVALAIAVPVAITLINVAVTAHYQDDSMTRTCRVR
jgi:hypothetical protein